MTVLQKLFISSFFPVFLFSYTISLESDINVYSNRLYLDLFDNKWQKIPSNENMNRAFDYSSLILSFNKKKYSLGIGYYSEGLVKINKGFIQTWYYADNNFNTLLKKSDVGYYITEPKIYELLNYSQFRSVFYKKNYKGFSLKFSIIQGKVLQYMKVNGINYKNRFIADLNYYYSDKNILMTNYLKSNNYKGLGYSVDVFYKKIFPTFEYSLGFYNILGAVRWKNIILMKYHFDSDTRYKDENGYYHYRPFGIGRFIKTDFYQKLPFYISYKFKKLLRKFFIEDEGLYSSGTRYDSFFLGKKYFKVGYVPQIKNVIFGIESKNINVELSNNIKYHSKFLKILIKLKY